MDVMQWNNLNNRTGGNGGGGGRHLWSDMVSPGEYNQFVSSGAAGPGATYYDFQNWKQGQADAARSSQQSADVMSLAKMADPFSGERSTYQAQLRDLMGFGGGTAATETSAPQAARTMGQMLGPKATAPAATMQAGGGSTDRFNQVMQSNPFFQANMDAGQEAAMRRLRQMGMGDSGNAAFELQKQAQSNMSGEYWKMADLLGKFSGANSDPSSGANAAINMMQLNENRRQFDIRNRPQSSYGGGGSTNISNLPGMSRYWGG